MNIDNITFRKAKQLFILCSLSTLFSGQPAINSQAQEIPDYKILPETSTNIKKRTLFREAISNQDTLSVLIKEDKGKKVIIVKKIYVKVFKTVPVYVPIYDSLISVPDTLVGRYFVEDLDLTKTPPKKKSLIKRIFLGKNK